VNKIKKNWIASKNSFFLNALFLSSILGFFGIFLIEYGFIYPVGNLPLGDSIEITALGSKTSKSKNSEIWFYGAFKVKDNTKIDWDQLTFDNTWERRDGVFISYKNQPSRVILAYSEPIRLDFGSHPYSGMVSIKWRGQIEKINLYSINSTTKNVFINQRPTYRNSKLYPYLITGFIFLGISLSVLFVYFGWLKIYNFTFCIFLSCSIYLTLAAFFPGVYTADSGHQLQQALTKSYDDWHPPLMAWMWSQLITVSGRIESILVVHLTLLALAAIYWARILEHLRLVITTLAIPVLIASPIVTNFSGVIWKDVGFAFSLLLASGITGLAFVEKNATSTRMVAILALLSYAFGIRPNGLIAIIPILMLFTLSMFSLEKWEFSAKKILSITTALSILLLGLIVVGVHFFSYQYLKTEKKYPIQYLQLYDIAGISTITDLNYFPDFIKNSPTHNIQLIYKEYVKSITVLGNANNILFRDQSGNAPLIHLNADSALQKQLRDSWVKAILNEPYAYFKHRIYVFDFLMSKGSYPSEKPQDKFDRNSVLKVSSFTTHIPEMLELTFLNSDSAKDFIFDSLALTQGSVLRIGWFWLILLFIEFGIGLLMLRHTRYGLVVLMVSTSGLLYTLPYLIIAPASDFRYLYWSSISASILVILITALTVAIVRSNRLRNQAV
jgi:hypothetical protein